MTSTRRFQIDDRGRRAESGGSAAGAVIFVVLANLMLFGALAAVLLPRNADAKADARPTPAVAMAMTTPSDGASPAVGPAASEPIPTASGRPIPAPAAALARPSVMPGASSLVLARSVHRMPRICPGADPRRVSLAAVLRSGV